MPLTCVPPSSPSPPRDGGGDLDDAVTGDTRHGGDGDGGDGDGDAVGGDDDARHNDYGDDNGERWWERERGGGVARVRSSRFGGSVGGFVVAVTVPAAVPFLG